MTTTQTNSEATKHETTAKPAEAPKPKPAVTTIPTPPAETKPAKAPKEPLAASEAVRLMLTTLKRVPQEDRARVLATLATLAE